MVHCTAGFTAASVCAHRRRRRIRPSHCFVVSVGRGQVSKLQVVCAREEEQEEVEVEEQEQEQEQEQEEQEEE